jgi:hypothetical protein
MSRLGRRKMLLAVFLTTTACRGGCGRSPAPVARGPLAPFPADARTVVGLDFARIRTTAFWQRLSALAAQGPEDRKLIDDFVARTGLDPFRQIQRAVAAFPEEARATGEFGVLIEGEGFDEKRLLTYARDQAKVKGTELRQVPQGRITLWTSPKPGAPAGFFLDTRRLVLAGGSWAARMASIAQGGPGAPPSAGTGGELDHLVERLGTARSIWLGAVIPAALRGQLLSDPRFGPSASVMRLALGADLGPGLDAELLAELSNAGDARALVAKVEGFVREVRASPQALLMGAGPYLDAIKASAEGPNVRIRVALDEARTNELLARLIALARARR